MGMLRGEMGQLGRGSHRRGGMTSTPGNEEQIPSELLMDMVRDLNCNNSYKELYNLWFNRLVNYLHACCNDWDLSEDIAQETLLGVYVKRDTWLSGGAWAEKE